MKLQFVLALLLVAIVAVFAHDAAPAAAAPAKVDVEAIVNKKLASFTKTNDETVLKVKSLVDEISTLKKAVETLAKENSALKAALEKNTVDAVNARVTKLDELVRAVSKQVEEVKVAVAESSIYNEAAKFTASARVVAEKYYAIAAAKSKVYFAEASVFAEKNAGPAFVDFKRKATEVSMKFYEKSFALYKVWRDKLTKLMIEKGVPEQHAPFATLVVFSLAAFIVAIIALQALLSILAALCCCCCRKSKKAAKGPANTRK